jgi:hypothetical protein
MSTNSDFTLIKEKKIDKETTLKITKNIMSGRIFVEFTSDNPRIVLQKNFQDSLYGKLKSEEFVKSIKSTDQLREYFGIKKKEA